MFTNYNFYPTLKIYPEHVALIPDGGRRWAKEHNCSYYDSYTKSTFIIMDIMDMVFSRGSGMFTVFFSSTGNFRRPKSEVEAFATAEWDFIMGRLLPHAIKYGISLKVIGTRDDNLAKYKDEVEKVEQLTRTGSKVCNICYNYNSLDEIQHALQESNGESDSFVSRLMVPLPVDVLIRTGGANVLSNFLLPQLAAARLYFVDTLFNDFSCADAENIIQSYINTELKYGE